MKDTDGEAGSGDELKRRQREMWASGNFEVIADTVAPASEALIGAAGVAEGHEVLDVGTGTGTAAVLAARRGATATGLDLTPELLAKARKRSASEGLEVDWVEGDAERLPFPDDSFDRVVSSFGVMFAPDHAAAARELVRVCRPGGRIAVSAWTPEGLNGRLLATLASHMPPPPPGFVPPILWGVEDHVRDLFDSHRASVEHRREELDYEAPSVEDWVSLHERDLGPMVVARSTLGPEGWPEARAQIASIYEDANELDDGFHARAEYLLTLATPGD